VLSAPAAGFEQGEDGLLQTWEIFERLRTDAELVTLSACETGLGKDVEGEGLIGLTRAFLYAGAHSVLASLWSVQDPSTAELMTRFYQQLAAGKSKDEALRLAQIDLMQLKGNGPNNLEGGISTFSNAFHWAGFVLYGEPH
jgi:CHAT domain-containing protein